MFKKMLASVGVGGATVDAELASNQVRPGESVQGRVRLTGGSVEQEIQAIDVGLEARVRVSRGDEETIEDVDFARVRIAESFTLQPEAEQVLDFTVEVPWETPPTAVGGQPLRGVQIGVNTELAIAGAIDRGDLDPLMIHALPAQEHVLQALGQLGFGFHKADLERGALRGTNQRLPFYQEIELRPGGRYQGLNELEVSFVTGPQAMEMVLEADKKGGLLTEGRDSSGHFTVEHATVDNHDWADTLDKWLSDVGRRRGLFG